MKQVYIKYQNFGKNVKGKFDILSDRGSGIPNELYSTNLMKGSVINIPDDASKVHIVPKIYNFIASDNSQISGLKFYLKNPSGIYNSENDEYYIRSITKVPMISGDPNFEFIQSITGLQYANNNASMNDRGKLAIAHKILSSGGNSSGIVRIYDRLNYNPSNNYTLIQNISGASNDSTFGTKILLTNQMAFIGNANNRIYIYKNTYPYSSYDPNTDIYRLVQILNINASGSNYSISSDYNNNTLIVGMPDNWIGGYKAGLVNIYSGNPGIAYLTGIASPWTLKQSITGNAQNFYTTPHYNFGESVSINYDSKILAIGGVNSNGTFIYTGSLNSKWILKNIISDTGNVKFNNWDNLFIDKSFYLNTTSGFLLQNKLNTDNPNQKINSINFNYGNNVLSAHIGGYWNNPEYISIYTGSQALGWVEKYRHSKNFPTGSFSIQNVLMEYNYNNSLIITTSNSNNTILNTLIYNNKPQELSFGNGWAISKIENNDYPRQFFMTGAGATYTNGLYSKIGMLNDKPMYSGIEQSNQSSLLRYGLNDYERQSYISYSGATGAYYFKINSNTSFPQLSGEMFSRLNQTFNSNPLYYGGYYGNYALWRSTGNSPVWTIGILDNTGNSISARFVKSNTGILITGLYTGINGFSGQFNLVNTSGIIIYSFPITGVYPKQWYLSSTYGINVSGIPQWEGHPDDFYYLNGDINVNDISTGNWTYDGPAAIQGPPPKFFPIYGDAFSKNITGIYSSNGVNLTGSAIIESLSPKLHVFNTPGITGFAGTYTSGNYIIGGVPRTAFRKENVTVVGGYANTGYFYIYKNNLPSEWRAVEETYNGTFTWYTNLNGNNSLPPTTGWLLGGGDKQPYINPEYGPVPEMNFGTCPGTTLVYPDYVFQAFSSISEIHKIQFYSGGYINNDGTSSLFPENTSIKDIFPDIAYNFFHKNYYYSNFINSGRYYLFCTLDNAFSNKWLLTKYPNNLTTGYSYWTSEYSYINYTGKDTLATARKIYYPTGLVNSINTVKIDVNRKYINNTLYVQNLDISNYSGFIHLQNIPRDNFISIDNVFQQRVGRFNTFFRQTITGAPQIASGVSGIPTLPSVRIYQWNRSGNIANYVDGNPNYVVLSEGSPIDITISGIISGTSRSNDTIQWFANTLPVGGYSTIGGYWSSFNLTLNKTNINTGRFNLESSGFTNFVQKFTGYLPYFNNVLLLSGATSGSAVRSLSITLSGAFGSYSGITRYRRNELETLDGLYQFKIGNSGIYSGLRYFQNNNYIFANPLFRITGARCFDSGTNIWSILDTNYNYINWKNCESRPSQFPSQFWVSGSGGFNESIDFKIIPLYLLSRV